MPYRETDSQQASRTPRTFVYVPRARRWFHWFVDLGIVGAILFGVWQYAWHWEISCAWQGTRASCTRTSEDAIGRRKVQQIDGIRNLAFARDLHVGFVTDAEHAGTASLFATDEVVVGTPEQADELSRFADERYPRSVTYRAGLPRPHFVTVFGLLAVFAWAFFTRTRRYRVTVDPRERLLVVDGGWLRGKERFELGTTQLEVEHATGGRHRVALRTKDGARPITDAYHPGKHHAALVRAVREHAQSQVAPTGES